PEHSGLAVAPGGEVFVTQVDRSEGDIVLVESFRWPGWAGKRWEVGRRTWEADRLLVASRLLHPTSHIVPPTNHHPPLSSRRPQQPVFPPASSHARHRLDSPAPSR